MKFSEIISANRSLNETVDGQRYNKGNTEVEFTVKITNHNNWTNLMPNDLALEIPNTVTGVLWVLLFPSPSCP